VIALKIMNGINGILLGKMIQSHGGMIIKLHVMIPQIMNGGKHLSILSEFILKKQQPGLQSMILMSAEVIIKIQSLEIG